MSAAPEELAKPTIVGRSSSHFTRITRIFAAELGVDHSFLVVRNLMSVEPGDYGGNPALKLPALKTSKGAFFGALNVCRELWRQSGSRARVLWPEGLEGPRPANAQELTLQAMATEVSLIMGKVSGVDEANSHQAKMRESLSNTMAWLEGNAAGFLGELPSDRDLSFLEVSLFCLVTHLEFREVLPVGPYRELNGFCQRFAARPSAANTAYRFDP